MTRPQASEAAHLLINERYPNCTAAFLAGSVIRGEGTATSDLDVVVIADQQTDPSADSATPVGPFVPADTIPPFRESLLFAGWPVEAFIHTTESLTRYFASDAERRQPTLPTMCAEGLVLRNTDGLADRIVAEAQALLAAGPAPFSDKELAMRRYMLTDALDDLAGSTVPAETLFIAVHLGQLISDFVLATNGRWCGQSKWAMRALRRYDAAWADRLALALAEACNGEDVGPLIALADEALAPVGGRLFDGFWQAGRQK